MMAASVLVIASSGKTYVVNLFVSFILYAMEHMCRK